MRGVGTLATPLPRPSLSITPASSQDTGSGEAPREREEMGQPGAGLWGTILVAQVGCGQPVPCCQQSPSGAAWGVWQDQLTSSDCRYMEHRTQRGGRKRGPWRGMGRRGMADCALDSHATPSWVPVLPCLSLPSYGMGLGGRLWRQRGQVDAWSPASQRRPPTSGPQHCGPWLWLPAPVLATWAPGSQSQRFCLRGWRRAGPGQAVGTRPRRAACPTCRFFLHTFTAANASCICFRRASLCRL